MTRTQGISDKKLNNLFRVFGTQKMASILAWLAMYLTASGPRVSYKGTEINEYAEQAWSTMSHSGIFMK
nr:hypothetical protein Iba_chr10bCG6780 [Ipomoea batatas]